MADEMITDGMKQQVITRLATINSATSILSLINGRPAKVTVEEVLTLAERIERWAWRDLLGERPDAQTQEKLAPQAEPTKPAPLVQPTTAKPEPAASNGDRQRPTPAPQTQRPPAMGRSGHREANQRHLRHWQEQRL